MIYWKYIQVVWVSLILITSFTYYQCCGSVTFWSWSFDPHTGLRIRIRILLFLAVAVKMPTENELFFYFFLTSVFKDNMSLRSHKTVEIMVFCLLMKQNFAIFHGNETAIFVSLNLTTDPVREPSTINNKKIQHLHWARIWKVFSRFLGS